MKPVNYGKKLEKCKEKIDNITSKYIIKNPSELEKLIKKGKVKEHPAWEELIELETLTRHLKELQRLAR